MKKLMILLAIVFTVNVMMAQSKDRTNAFGYNRNGEYKKAMESIEKCVNHEQFLGQKADWQSQAWLYRAMIYQNVLLSDDEELKALAPNAMEIVYESLLKCMENKSFFEENKQEIIQRVNVVMNAYYSAGATAFDAGDYANAVEPLKKAYDIANTLGSPEANEMLKFAAYAAFQAKDYDTAITYYTELRDNGYEGEDLYHNMAAAYLAKDDKEKANDIISAGLEKFPGSNGLIREKVSIKLMDGKGAEAIADLEKLLEGRPDDVDLMFALGAIYGDERNGEIYDADKAIQYFEEVLKINPNHYDAVYNLGVMYISKSNKLKTQANELPLSEAKAYNELVSQAEELVRTGLPFIKQAYEAQPTPEVKKVLKTMYVQLKMNDEAKALDAE